MEDIEEHIINGLTIRIDRTMCICSDSCTQIAPEIFEIGDDVVVTFTDASPDYREGQITGGLFNLSC